MINCHVTYQRSGLEESSRMRDLVPVLQRGGGAGVGRGSTARATFDLQVLVSVNCVVSIVRPSQRLDQVKLPPGSDETTEPIRTQGRLLMDV